MLASLALPARAFAGESGAASIEGPRDDDWDGPGVAPAKGAKNGHSRVPYEVSDLHVDTPHQLVRRGGYSLKRRLPFQQIDVPRLRAGNVTTQFFALWPPPAAVTRGRADAYCRRALAAIRKAAKESGAITMVATEAEALRARASGKIAAFLGMEGAECLMGKVENLAAWKKEGLAYLGLTWNFVNPFATPATVRGVKPDPSRGLTALGHALVAEAERLGVLVDISHSNMRTFWDVYRAAKRPFIASHSSSWAVRRHPRNIDDEQARALARVGGVVGVNYYRPFVKAGRTVTVDDVATHVKHLVDVAGARHVALGSDFDGDITVPDRLEDPSKLHHLVAALRERGMSSAELKLVLGENVRRVLRELGNDHHEGAKRVPLAVRDVAPSRARALFDRSDRTTFRFPRKRSATSARVRVVGQPTFVAVHRCDAGAKGSVELLQDGERVSRLTFSGDTLREERVLPPLPSGRYEMRVSGSGCLREVTLYGP